MSTTTAEEKARLRTLIRDKLSKLPDAERMVEDNALFSAFLTLPEVAQTHTIFLFCGAGTEPDTARLFAPLLDQGKRLALPRILPDRQMEVRQYCPDRPLLQHPFGILEPDENCPPIPVQEIGLALVPALCYDRRGFRLGMGGGYYDRWLAHYSGITVGLCRQALVQDTLPTQPHDRPVDLVVTPEAVLNIK